MKWNLSYLPEAKKDMRRLDGREGLLVQKALEKVWTNPLSVHEGLTVPHGNGGKNTDYKARFDNRAQKNSHWTFSRSMAVILRSGPTGTLP